MRPSVWIVGDWRQAEFSSALTWLEERASCERFDDAEAALANFRSGGRALEPADILVVQSRPGQISPREIEQLHAAAPLARLVAILGAWCDGAIAKCEAALGIVCIPWRAWEGRLASELALCGTTNSLAALLPRTATATERIEKACSGGSAGSRYQGRAAICTISRETYQALADGLLELGISSRWHLPESGVSIGPPELSIFDGWEQVPGVFNAEMTADDSGASPSLLLLHFPRPEDAERAVKMGISAVLAQPLLRIDLIATVDRLWPKVNQIRRDEPVSARRNLLP